MGFTKEKLIEDTSKFDNLMYYYCIEIDDTFNNIGKRIIELKSGHKIFVTVAPIREQREFLVEDYGYKEDIQEMSNDLTLYNVDDNNLNVGLMVYMYDITFRGNECLNIFNVNEGKNIIISVSNIDKNHEKLKDYIKFAETISQLLKIINNDPQKELFRKMIINNLELAKNVQKNNYELKHNILNLQNIINTDKEKINEIVSNLNKLN